MWREPNNHVLHLGPIEELVVFFEVGSRLPDYLRTIRPLLRSPTTRFAGHMTEHTISVTLGRWRECYLRAEYANTMEYVFGTQREPTATPLGGVPE
jgi:hypothetical protein